MTLKLRAISIVVLSLALAACESDRGPKEVGGALVGAAVGGLLGSQIGGGRGQLAAVAAGTLLGAYLGTEVGRSLDRADRLHAERAAQHSLETTRSGTASRWVNPDNGHAGSFTPLNSYRSADGLDCRDYDQVITVEGRSQTARGTACRQPDGSWRIVNPR
jgi:surface antigen